MRAPHSRRQLDVLQVRKVAGNHPWKDIFCDILGVRRGFCEQPEQRYLGELGELMVAYLPQQARALRRLHDLAQGFEPLLDEGVFIEIRRGIFGFIGQANEIQGPQAVAYGKHRPVDRLGPEALPHPGEIDFRQLRLESYCLEIQRHGLPDIDHLWEPRQRVEIHGNTTWRVIAYEEERGIEDK